MTGRASTVRSFEDQRRFHIARVTASRRVAAAIGRGSLEAERCRVCGSLGSDAHHEDYGQPFLIWWLCASHHKIRHAEIECRAKGTDTRCVLCSCGVRQHGSRGDGRWHTVVRPCRGPLCLFCPHYGVHRIRSGALVHTIKTRCQVTNGALAPARERMAMMERTQQAPCERCGGKMTPGRHGQHKRFCSAECGQRSWQDRNPRQPRTGERRRA